MDVGEEGAVGVAVRQDVAEPPVVVERVGGLQEPHESGGGGAGPQGRGTELVAAVIEAAVAAVADEDCPTFGEPSLRPARRAAACRRRVRLRRRQRPWGPLSQRL